MLLFFCSETQNGMLQSHRNAIWRSIRKDEEMKNRKMKTWMLMITVVLATVTGCGDAGSTTSLNAEKPPEETFSGDTEAPYDDGGEDSAEDNLAAPTQSDGNEVPEADDGGGDGKPEDTGENDSAGNAAKEEAYLIGNVKSIGSDSFVASKSYTEGDGILVAPAEGSSDEELVTIYVSDATQYEVKNVKNSGVNGDADVERRAGSFSDLKETCAVEISGYYDGENIQAEIVTISFFV